MRPRSPGQRPWVRYDPQPVPFVRQSRAWATCAGGVWPLPACVLAGRPIATCSGRSGGNIRVVSRATGKPVSSMSVSATWKSAPPIEWYWSSSPMIGPEL